MIETLRIVIEHYQTISKMSLGNISYKLRRFYDYRPPSVRDQSSGQLNIKLSITNKVLARYSKKKYGDKYGDSALTHEKSLTELTSLMISNQYYAVTVRDATSSEMASTNMHKVMRAFYSGASEEYFEEFQKEVQKKSEI